MTDARETVLARIRSAIGPDPTPVTVPRTYTIDTPLDRTATLDRFAHIAADYQATVHRTTPDQVAQAVATALGDARTVVIPHDLDRSWLPHGLDIHPDTPHAPLTVDTLDTADAVITAAALGIADTGTIILDTGPGQGRRAITLIPDHHVCIIHADQITTTVPQGIRHLNPTRPQTWISGPSATSDIELDRVEGVHGPRTLHIILIDR